MASLASVVTVSLVALLWWRLVLDWLGCQSSDGHRAVLFDLGQFYPSIDVNSESGPHDIEKWVEPEIVLGMGVGDGDGAGVQLITGKVCFLLGAMPLDAVSVLRPELMSAMGLWSIAVAS